MFLTKLDGLKRPRDFHARPVLFLPGRDGARHADALAIARAIIAKNIAFEVCGPRLWNERPEDGSSTLFRDVSELAAWLDHYRSAQIKWIIVAKSYGAIVLSTLLKQDPTYQKYLRKVIIVGAILGEVDLKAIRCSTVIVQGEFDRFGSPKAARSLVRRMKLQHRVSVVSVAGADHSMRPLARKLNPLPKLIAAHVVTSHVRKST